MFALPLHFSVPLVFLFCVSPIEMVQISAIKNKIRRRNIYEKYLEEKAKHKEMTRKKRLREAEELGEEPPKKIPRTLDNTRELDETIVKQDDEEVFGDEAEDEFVAYFSNQKKPKIMLTTRPKPSKNLFNFLQDLQNLIPNSFYYPRRGFAINEIIKFASNKDFTHLIVLGEKAKESNGLILTHLPAGPTAFFKVSSYLPGNLISGHGRPTSHTPELILNHFNTRLGRRIGRFLGSLYPHEPEFKGRQVATYHNQRDFVFVRLHRYVFEQKSKEEIKEIKKRERQLKKKALARGKKYQRPQPEINIRTRLQELGPRFTLKLRWMQTGTFDSKFGEYEWIWKRRELEATRRKFNL